MSEKISRAILTGATGMIGCALIQELLESGAEVAAFVRSSSEKKKNLPFHENLHIINMDLSELREIEASAERIQKLWNDSAPSAFGVLAWFHLGWAGTFGKSARNDMYLQNENIRYTLDAVHIAKKLNCQVFVGAGSQAEYGRADLWSGKKEFPLSPDTPTFPENGYGIAKLAAGQMSRILCRELGIRHEWVRILSVYGPMDGEKTMVMSAIRALQKGERLSFSAGEQRWDYLYASDAARALCLVAERGTDGAVYPLGSGMARPLKDYILEIRNAINPNAEIGLGELPYAPDQMMYLRADIQALKQDTGFEPQVMFSEGIRRTVEWANHCIKNA